MMRVSFFGRANQEEFTVRIAMASFLFVAASLTDAALAQTASERAACKADFENYCPGVRPGGNRIIECLAAHISELSPDCQKVVEAHMPDQNKATDNSKD